MFVHGVLSHIAGPTRNAEQELMWPMDKFAEAGYGQRDIGFGARPALIIVDFQKGFTDASNPLGRSDRAARGG